MSENAENTATLNELVGRLYDLKRIEESAKKDRVETEEKIAALVATPENGSRTVDAGDGVKCTVKRALGYKADVDALRALDVPEEVLPLKLQPAAYVFDAKRYEAVREAHPDVAAKLAEHVTVTPRKPSVTLKM